MTKPKTTVPAHLSTEAKRRWSALIAEYGIDDCAGLSVLQAGLESFDRVEASRLAIEKDGATTTDRFEQVKAHPLLAVERDSRAAYLQALKQLNLDVVPAGPVGRPPSR